MELTKSQKINIEGTIEEAVKFGCCIGSWTNSKIPWHNFIAKDCVQSIKKYATLEIESYLREKNE